MGSETDGYRQSLHWRLHRAAPEIAPKALKPSVLFISDVWEWMFRAEKGSGFRQRVHERVHERIELDRVSTPGCTELHGKR